MMSYDLYKLWLTDLSPALAAWIWLLTCQHWDLKTKHMEPGSHVPSHRMWVTRVTFLECYSMPLSWVVFNISRLEHFSDFWFKALANWFIAPCTHPAVFCSPGSDWTSQSVVSHDSGHNSVPGPDAHLCWRSETILNSKKEAMGAGEAARSVKKEAMAMATPRLPSGSLCTPVQSRLQSDFNQFRSRLFCFCCAKLFYRFVQINSHHVAHVVGVAWHVRVTACCFGAGVVL